MLIEMNWSEILLEKKVKLTEGLKSEIISIISEGPYLDRLFINSFMNPINEGKRIVILGNELNEDIAKNFFEMDLFSSSEEIFILEADSVSSVVSEVLLQNLKMGNTLQKSLRFFFSKDGKFSRELSKAKITTISLKGPKFWEYDKVLDILCQKYSLPLSSEIKNYLVASLQLELGDYYNAVLRLIQEQDSHKDEKLTIKIVSDLFPEKRLDQFLLAHLFGQKKWGHFFQKLSLAHLDFSELEEFSRFMQGHLLKLLDAPSSSPSTKYEREIKSYCHLWKKDEVLQRIAQFSDWQVMSKEKSDKLKNVIELELFKNHPQYMVV